MQPIEVIVVFIHSVLELTVRKREEFRALHLTKSKNLQMATSQNLFPKFDSFDRFSWDSLCAVSLTGYCNCCMLL